MGFVLNEFVALTLGHIVEFVYDSNNPRLQVFIQKEIFGACFSFFGDLNANGWQR